MSNMDDFLASMGIAPEELPPSSQQLLGDAEPTVTVPEQPQQVHELTANDFNDILDDLGFNPPDADAEEIVEEEDEDDGYEAVSTGSTALNLNSNIADLIRSIGAEQYLQGATDVTISEDGNTFIFSYPNGAVNRVPITVPITGTVVSAEYNHHNDSVYFHHADGHVTEVPIQAESLGIDDEGNVSVAEEEDITEETSSEVLIPENSPTLTVDVSTSRFSGAEWYELVKQQKIIIGGCGGISSWLAFQVARLSPETIVIYDDDVVELGNLSGQLFSRDDVNRNKVHSIANLIARYNEYHRVSAVPSRFTANTEAGDIMMCGFDNMEARETFFESWRRHVISLPEERRKECLFLDGRLSISILQVFCITGDDVYNTARYSDEFLFDDADADETVCSMKQTTYMACMIGSIMTNLFVNFIANLTCPVLPYDLPFFTEYDAQNMIFKTEK